MAVNPRLRGGRFFAACPHRLHEQLKIELYCYCVAIDILKCENYFLRILFLKSGKAIPLNWQ